MCGPPFVSARRGELVGAPLGSSGSTRLSGLARCGYSSGPDAAIARTSDRRWVDHEWRSDRWRTSCPGRFAPERWNVGRRPGDLSLPERNFPVHRFHRDIFRPEPRGRLLARRMPPLAACVLSRICVDAEVELQPLRTHPAWEWTSTQHHWLAIDWPAVADRPGQTGLHPPRLMGLRQGAELALPALERWRQRPAGRPEEPQSQCSRKRAPKWSWMWRARENWVPDYPSRQRWWHEAGY